MGFDKVGCFGDKLSKPRPLPRMIFTDKEINSPVYSGVPLDWAKWNEYIIGLACRCADAASQMGYSYFSLQSYGKRAIIMFGIKIVHFGHITLHCIYITSYYITLLYNTLN